MPNSPDVSAGKEMEFSPPIDREAPFDEALKHCLDVGPPQPLFLSHGRFLLCCHSRDPALGVYSSDLRTQTVNRSSSRNQNSAPLNPTQPTHVTLRLKAILM